MDFNNLGNFILAENYTAYGCNIPKGFITDFASIPLYFRWFFSQRAKWNIASLKHDYLYHTNSQDEILRKKIDIEFKEDMAKDGLNQITIFVIYNIVRLFGKSRFNKTKV